MKTRHFILGSAAALGILILGGMLLYFSPPVQRMIVARLVDPRPGDVFEMDYARVGLTRTEIRGFRLERPDIAYRVERLSADLSVFDIYFRRHVILGEIVATGVEFDFTRFWTVPRPEDPDPLAGLLGELDVPVMLTIDRGRVEGRFLFPGAGKAPLVAGFQIRGRGLDIGSTGRFQISGRIEDPNAERWLRELEFSGEISLGQHEEGFFKRLEGALKLQAFGPEAPFEEAVLADVILVRTEAGEDYRATLQLDRPDAPPQPLLNLKAAFAAADLMFEGSWQAWAEAGQIAGFVHFERLPDFSGRGEGSIAFDSASHALGLTGTFSGRTGELGVLAGELEGLGGFGLESRFEFWRDDEWFRLDDLIVSIRSEAADSRLLEVRAHHPFHYHRKTGQVDTPSPDTPLLEILAANAPVEWAGLLRAPDDQARPILRRGEISGRVLISGHNRDFQVEVLDPILTSPVDVAFGGELVLTGVGLEVSGAASRRETAVSVRLDPLEITVDGERAFLFRGVLSAEERISGRFEADLALLLHQPALSFQDLLSGRLEGEFSGELERGFRAGLLFRNGRMAEAEEGLPPIHLNLEAREEEDGTWVFRAPLLIDRPGFPSDLELRGRAAIREAGRRVDLQLNGGHLFAEDLANLINAFTPPERERKPREERDDLPFWRGWNGSFRAEFLSLQFADGYSFGSPAAMLEMTQTLLEGAAEAVFLGSPVRVESRLEFDPGRRRPYSLDGDLTAPAVDLGTLFQSLQPTRPPTVEGLFAFTGDLLGDGLNAGDLLERTRGQLRIRSDGGIFRLFYTENPLVGLGLGVAALIGILGGEFGTILEIAQELGNIEYHRIDVRVERDQNLDIRLHDLTVLSPEFHLSGGGVIRHQDDRRIPEHPMELELNLAARGHLEELLGRAAVLSEERDALGYRRMYTSFEVEGSPADPNVAPFFSVVVQAILGLTLPLPGRAEAEEERAAPPLEPDYGRPER